MEETDGISKVVILAVMVIVGITIFANAVIPIVIDTIGDLTGDNSRYNTILYLLPLVAILGLVVLVVRKFTDGGR